MRKPINYIFFVMFFILAGGLGNILIAQTNEEAIKQMLEERDREIKTLIGPEGTEYSPDQRQKLKSIINDVIDYKAMSKFALQDTWGQLSAGEREEFVELFSSIIREHSLTNLDIYRAEVTYENILINGNNAVVVTLATLDRVRTPVTYNLHFEDDMQQWVVTDLNIDDVSTVRSYRRQFQDIINSEGYESLIETLRERVSR